MPVRYAIAPLQQPPSALTVTDEAVSSPRVAGAWQELQDAAYTPFDTWAWTSGLAALPDSFARVLMASVGNRPVAVLPVERDRDVAGLRRLRIAGSSWLSPDHVDILGKPTWTTAAAHAFVDHLRTTADWDLLDFSGLRPDGALTAAIDHLSGPRFRHLAPEDVECPYVLLSSRQLTEGRFSHNLRSQLRRGLRAAEKSGGGLDVMTDPAQVRAAMGTLMTLHNARFKERSTVFNSPQRRAFHLRVSEQLARGGMARVYRLHDGSADVALLYSLHFRNRAYYYSMGLRTDVRGSPGLTLLGNAILLSADEGLAEFDLLRGDHPFKLRFATDVRTDIRKRVLRVNARSGVRAVGHLLRRKLSNTGRAPV